MKKDTGYQYLGNNFWELCKQRKIYRLPQHLYIYLRGRYCKYGPEFDWSDVEIRGDLGITQQTLSNAKKYLQERGLILFKSGTGKKVTRYTMLTSVLLPENKKSRVMKIITLSDENHQLGYQKSSPRYIQVKKQVKKQVRVSHTKNFKRYNPNSEESLKYKKKLKKILED